MLSTKTNVRILLGFILIGVFCKGSNELRIAVSTMCLWALGLIAYHRLPLSAGFLRAHAAFVLASFCLLAATNDIFYENVFGRVFDIWFDRASYDPDVPGSGFTDWRMTFVRHHRYDIDLAWRFLRFAILSTVGFFTLPFAVAFAAWCRKSSELERAIAYLSETGEQPPWLIEREKPQTSVPKRDTRYMRLGSDDIIFVCGVGGGFERMVAGDYESAISRRRGLWKQFA